MTQQHPALGILHLMRQWFPFLDDELRRCQMAAQRKLSLTEADIDRLVLAAISDGCSSMEDLLDETGLPKQVLKDSLHRLVDAGAIVLRQSGGAPGVRGKKLELFFLPDTPLGSDLILPQARCPNNYSGACSEPDAG